MHYSEKYGSEEKLNKSVNHHIKKVKFSRKWSKLKEIFFFAAITVLFAIVFEIKKEQDSRTEVVKNAKEHLLVKSLEKNAGELVD